MNDFLSWCMHLLVPFLFHDVYPYIPLHFIEMFSPTILVQSPIKNVMFCAGCARRARVLYDDTHAHKDT